MGETLGPDANLSESVDYTSEPMALEDRLEHFLTWLTTLPAGEVTILNQDGEQATSEYLSELVQEYVNE